MDQYDCISPLDYRYFDETAAKYLSGNARIRYQARAEAALVRALAKRGLCSDKVAQEVKEAAEKVTAEEVALEEDKTKHDIRALVNCIRNKISDEAKPFVHLAATSYDIVDSGNSLEYKTAVEELLAPELKKLEQTLIMLALREKATLQIGRTHGQHAEPITFGYFIACYVSRLGQRINSIRQNAGELKGKFSGAVGCYNAASLLFNDVLEFEKEYLAELGLCASPSSTQIVEAEPLADLCHSITTCFGVLANLSDDLRHLQRSEISEVAEAFDSKQVGSSTMPHKRNPINFENVKSLYKQFMPRMVNIYLDEICEHQRDLTNSASQRFVPELIFALYSCTKRLNKVLAKLVVDKESMARNFDAAAGKITAEPLYILFAHHGHPDAHEFIKQLTIRADKEKKPLREILENDAEGRVWLAKLDERQKAMALDAHGYTGVAAEKTQAICDYWKRDLNL